MRSAFFQAVARLNLLLRGILRGNILDERFGDGLVGGVPVEDAFPALAVQLLYAPLARALMVGAGNLDRLQHALEAEFLKTCIGDVEVLQTPTDLLARQRRLAELFLRLADRLHAEHGIHQTAVIENFAVLASLLQTFALSLALLFHFPFPRTLPSSLLNRHRRLASSSSPCA